MPNGKSLLLEYKAKMSCGDIPQGATNDIIMAAMVELWDTFGEMKKDVAEIKESMKVEKVESKDNVRFSELWNSYGKEVVKFLVLLLAAYLLARAGLKVP